jgi:hypothetical protein
VARTDLLKREGGESDVEERPGASEPCCGVRRLLEADKGPLAREIQHLPTSRPALDARIDSPLE